MTVYINKGQDKATGVVRKADGRWAAKVYYRGELYRDLGSFRTRREAVETAEYHIDYEVRG